MRWARGFATLWLATLAAGGAHAQGAWTERTIDGCHLRVRAYQDDYRRRSGLHPHPRLWRESRFDLEVAPAPGSPHQWDFTTLWPEYHATNAHGEQSRLPYGNAPTGTVDATLHEFDTLDERVTFHGLDLMPINTGDQKLLHCTPRYPNLPSPLTAVTPSGIRVTIPAQQPNGFFDFFKGKSTSGNMDALFLNIQITPSSVLSTLPSSTLYRQYRKPVRIQVGCEEPFQMCTYMADNTYRYVGIDLPDRKTATHLDTLTLVIRQRVDLKAIPLHLEVPVDRTQLASR